MAKKRSLNAVVTLRNEVSPWLMILQVAPYGWGFPVFRPGQFAFLGLPGSAARCAAAKPDKTDVDPGKLIKRAYSIASSPAQREYLEFYIALVPGGILTPRLFNLRVGDRVWLSKTPSGGFTFEDLLVPEVTGLILCTTGSGLAPFISMLGAHLKCASEQRVVLVHSVRHSWDLGYRSVLMTMQDLRSNFTYLPAISRPEDEFVPWNGHLGRVEDVWKSGAIELLWRKRPTPDDTHVFMCGSPAMSGSMVELLKHERFKVDTETELGQIHVEDFWQHAAAQPSGHSE